SRPAAPPPPRPPPRAEAHRQTAARLELGTWMTASGRGRTENAPAACGLVRTTRQTGTDRLRRHGLDDALLRDDPRDQVVWRHVEGRVVDGDAVRRRLSAEAVRHLAGVALLDGDGRARRQAEVERARRCGDVERDAVGAGEDGE